MTLNLRKDQVGVNRIKSYLEIAVGDLVTVVASSPCNSLTLVLLIGGSLQRLGLLRNTNGHLPTCMAQHIGNLEQLHQINVNIPFKNEVPQPFQTRMSLWKECDRRSAWIGMTRPWDSSCAFLAAGNSRRVPSCSWSYCDPLRGLQCSAPSLSLPSSCSSARLLLEGRRSLRWNSIIRFAILHKEANLFLNDWGTTNEFEPSSVPSWSKIFFDALAKVDHSIGYCISRITIGFSLRDEWGSDRGHSGTGNGCSPSLHAHRYTATVCNQPRSLRSKLGPFGCHCDN